MSLTIDHTTPLCAVLGIVTISMVTYMQKVMLGELCPTPHKDTGRGLMAFAACCSDEADGVPCDATGGT